MIPTSPRRRSWRSICMIVVLVTATIGGTSLAQSPAPNATSLPEGPIGEQMGWIIDAANGDVSVTDSAVIEAHFSPEYLEQVGLSGLIEFAYGLVRTWAPVTLDSTNVSEDGATGNATLVARDGTLLDLTVKIDPATGLIAGVLLVPSAAASPEASPAASPQSSPVASPKAVVVPPSFGDIEADYSANVENLTTVGQGVANQFLTDDFQAIVDQVAPELQSQVTVELLAASKSALTTNRIHFEFASAGAIFDGYVAGDTMEGFFSQGVGGTFTAKADAPQNGAVPTGNWSGVINEPGLEFSVSFAGDAQTLTATLSIPSQQLANEQLRNVSFEAERPIGDLVDEEAMPLGEANNSYRAMYAWGTGFLVLNIYQASDDSLISFTPTVQWTLPADPAVTSISVDPPFAGSWLTFWGGETEFQNYHAAYPQQRHALDIVVWKDGGSYSGDGIDVEDYYAYGQTLLAPVAGEVVAVETTLPNMPTAIAQSIDPAKAEEAASQSANQTPVGNHVVIRTEDGVFVFLAHMKPDSATVQVGDTVAAGDVIGQVGNTGNTSEPHIHIHAQTTADVADPAAIGVPIQWNNISVNGEPVDNATPERGDILESLATP